MKDKIKVLIVDDSASVRQTLSRIIAEDPDIMVIGVAPDPYIAARKIAEEEPNVITLDIEMPKMDGLTFLQKIMNQHPIPVVICSSLTERDCDLSFRALQLGAVDIISKPELGVRTYLEESKAAICQTIKAAASARIRRRVEQTQPEHRLSVDAMLTKPATKISIKTTDKVIVIGASTGGTEALRKVLCKLPADSPGIVVVQHMPERFTQAFAGHLDKECAMTVKEADDGDRVIQGRVLIAPGGRHTLLRRDGTRYFVEIQDGPPINRHKPSVDVLFRSAAANAGQNVIGVILTGMGDDGAVGMKEMHDAGAHTIAQDESTSVVFGMPKEAIAKGGVDCVLPIAEIAEKLLGGF